MDFMTWLTTKHSDAAVTLAIMADARASELAQGNHFAGLRWRLREEMRVDKDTANSLYSFWRAWEHSKPAQDEQREGVDV